MKTLVYPRHKRGTRREARRVRNVSRFLRKKVARTKVPYCVYCPVFR